MEGDKSESEYPLFDEIGNQFTDERRALLTAISRADGERIATPHLREQTGVKTGSMGYYMDDLLDWGLVEIVGEEQAGPGLPSNVYSLTGRGKDFLERPGSRTIPSQEEVRQLEGRIRELESENQSLVQDVKTLQEKHERMVDILEQMG
jgi:DNA-binding PadR family transcriptional regulator